MVQGGGGLWVGQTKPLANWGRPLGRWWPPSGPTLGWKWFGFCSRFFTQTTCKLVVSPWGQHWVAGGLLCPLFACFVSVFALFVMVQAFGLNWLKYRLNHLSAQTHFGSSPPIYHRALLGALVVGVGEVGDARVGASSWPSLGNRTDG